MRWSQLFVPMLKEVPKEASIQSHILMLRAGLITKQGSGVYTYLPLGLKILRNIHQIIEQEITALGAQEIVLPHLVERELWEKTNRYEKMGAGIFTLKDRHQNDFLLGPTHEESLVDMLSVFLRSYKQLPLNFFQIAKKFRDEVRPRYGVMRGREFTMMDGYSLHLDKDSLQESYLKYKKAYQRIFIRLGLETVCVSADSGAMGGDGSEEFMVRSHIGDDTILSCVDCGYAANQEKALFFLEPTPSLSTKEPQELYTPNIKSIEDLAHFCGIPKEYIAKTMAFKTKEQGVILAIVRSDREVSETKLQNFLNGNLFIELKEEEIQELVGVVGFLGPYHIANPAKVTLIVDSLLEGQQNMLIGSNKKDYHLNHFSFLDLKPLVIGDISRAVTGDICPSCKKGVLESFSGIEVGHLFKLGDDYTRKMKLSVLDKEGKPQFPLMGCYGIGVDRSFATIIEQNHDLGGMILPLSVSPFFILITPIGEEHIKIGQELYQEYQELYPVLLDDRDISAGVKLKEADLIGIPIRLTLGKKYKQENLIGVSIRQTREEVFLAREECLSFIEVFIKGEKEKERQKLSLLEGL